MSLKMLTFPIFIILSLSLVIGYIKPDIDEILQKRTDLAAAKADLARVDTVIQNIQSKSAEIDGRKEAEAFVLKYLPRTLEEERVLDTYNFLASESGLVPIGVVLKESTPQPRAAREITTLGASGSGAVPKTDAPAPGAPTPPVPTVKSYSAVVTALGTYPSIKDFLERLYRTDRFHMVKSMAVMHRDFNAISTAVNPNDKVVTYPPDFLKVVFNADFEYYPLLKVASALNMPLFQSKTFDFAAADNLIDLVKSPLPTLETGTSGKPNPFQ